MQPTPATLLRYVLAALFFVSGLVKLFAVEPVVEAFDAWGYTTSFMIAIGIIEIVGAALLLVNRLAVVGTSLLIVVMVGSVYTYFFRDEMPLLAVVPLALLVLLVYVGARTGAWLEGRREATLVRRERGRPLRPGTTG